MWFPGWYLLTRVSEDVKRLAVVCVCVGQERNGTISPLSRSSCLLLEYQCSHQHQVSLVTERTELKWQFCFLAILLLFILITICYDGSKCACVVSLRTQIVFALPAENHSALINRDGARLAVSISIK